MVSGNHWSCVHIDIETGDGLYADSIGREVPRYFETHLATFFKEYAKCTKKMTLLNSSKLLMKLDQQKVHTNVDIFV